MGRVLYGVACEGFEVRTLQLHVMSEWASERVSGVRRDLK